MPIAPCARAEKRSHSSILSTSRPHPNAEPNEAMPDEATPNEATPDESNVAEAYQGDDPAPESVTAIRREGSDAWPRFLVDFSPFMLSCIRRYAADQDERMEIYVHVCTRLAADNCRRIRQYRGYGSLGTCKFTTWLAAVIFNLAREWIRSSRGRRRLFKSVKDLSRIDRLVFRFYFWDGYSTGQIAMLLRSKEHLSCNVADVSQRLASIERQLSRDHRWRLVTALLRSAGPISIDRPSAVVGEEFAIEIPDRREDCGLRLERDQARQLLSALVLKLPDEERVALRLRFERGLTAREVAVALGVRNYKRVYEIQGRALAKLAEGLREQGLELHDFLGGSVDSFLVPR